MSIRLKRFALVSFIGVVVMLVAFVLFFRYLNKVTLSQHNETHNGVLVQIFTNSLEHHGLEAILGLTEVFGPLNLHDHIGPDDGHHDNVLPKRPHTDLMAEFDQTITEHIRGLPILKVTLYNREGVAVYSSEPSEIGRSADKSGYLQRALAGESVSEFDYREQFYAKGRTLYNVNLFESYIPIQLNNGRVMGGFEIYSDITESLEEQGLLERRMIIGVLLLLGASYTILFFLFFATDRDLQREEAERNAYLNEIEHAKDVLEERVLERTEEIESARYFLQSIINGIADPVMVIGMDLKVAEMNEAARGQLPEGAEGEEFEHCYQVSHRRNSPCDDANNRCSFNEVVGTGKTCKLLHSHYDADGEQHYVEVTSSPLRDINGDLIGIIETSHDVTDVVRARDQLKESEERVRAVMDTVASAILSIDGEGVIQDANRSAEKIFGYSSRELIGMAADRLLGESFGLEPDNGGRVVESYLGPLVSQGATEISVRNSSGLPIPVALWVGRLKFEGAPLYIAVFDDIRERKRAEEALEETRQQYFHQEKMAAIGQLAAGILHEVGNPIAAISGSLQAIHFLHSDSLAEGGDTTPGDISEHLGMIEQQVNRLAGITREIADFASPRPREMELLDLNALIKSTSNLMRYDKRVQMVELELDLDPVLPAINGVADQLTQILMNLIINAVDACESAKVDPARITISTCLQDEAIRLVVNDNGTGMEDDVVAHATDAFYTTKPAGKGTGLGLSLCESIMSKHGGGISIDSTVGEGTSVCLTFPFDPMDV